jgi:hypothetical protein
MATHPDANPDSLPPSRSDDVEQVTPLGTPGRESVEDTPGTDGGTSGTGGTNHRGDTDITS